ncbi:MAG: hypothetical protein JWM68_4947, partial [Verrucomicrobiales bacterium]|nr:hypothetical protein [Verrucomicrobiales bacterium]
LDDFFGKNDSYHEKQLGENLGITEEKAKRLLKWYARLELGKKIEKCLRDNGHCQFEAEL